MKIPLLLLLAASVAQATPDPPLPPTGIVLNNEGCQTWDLHWNFVSGVVWDVISSIDTIPGDGDICVACGTNHTKALFSIPLKPLNAKHYIYIHTCWAFNHSICSIYAYAGISYVNYSMCFLGDGVDFPPVDPAIDPETIEVPYAVKEPD